MGAPDTFNVDAFVALLDSGGWEYVAPLLDLTMGVQLDEATRHERLIARHVAYGNSPDAARTWALEPDEANAHLVTASLSRADALLRR